MTPIIEIRDARMSFAVRRGILRRRAGEIRAVDGVSLEIGKGEVLGLVGESGCGKSTLGRMLVGLLEPTGGEILFEGRRLGAGEGRANFQPAEHIQIIFQDPYSSLDPRLPVGESIAEGLVIHGMGDARSRRRAVADMLELVGLPPQAADRYPHEFSGGQRQRIGIARALILKPRFVVCDEPVSALDVSVQAQILNLLKSLQRELDLSLMFISHNLAVVDHLCDRVAVMYLGRIVEVAERREIFSAPRHPYTRALLSSIPVPDPSRRRERVVLKGDVPNPANLPPGCRFHTRCPIAMDICRVEPPLLKPVPGGRPGHLAECHAVEMQTWPEHPGVNAEHEPVV